MIRIYTGQYKNGSTLTEFNLVRYTTICLVLDYFCLMNSQKIDMEIIHMPQVPSEDTATWWRILKSGYEACGLDENLTIYRRPAKSLSSNKLEAIYRIWFLYRNIAGLSVAKSLFYFGGWAVRATLRRL